MGKSEMTDTPDIIASKRTKGNDQSLVVPLCSLYSFWLHQMIVKMALHAYHPVLRLLIKRAALGNLKASFHCTHWHCFFPLKKAFSKITPSLFTIKEGSTSHPAPLTLRGEGGNRSSSSLGTASLQGWRGIKALAMLCGMGPPGVGSLQFIIYN